MWLGIKCTQEVINLLKASNISTKSVTADEPYIVIMLGESQACSWFKLPPCFIIDISSLAELLTIPTAEARIEYATLAQYEFVQSI